MASMGWLGLGMTSVSGRGVSKQSGNNNLGAVAARAEKLEKAKSKRKVPLKLTYDEVQLIRALYEKGVSQKDIFAEHVEGKMTFSSMLNVLNYTTRVWS